MQSGCKATIALGMFIGVFAGCSDKPHDYGQDRPPVDQIDSRDRGLQSMDVVNASDKMAHELLSQPDLNESQKQWTIVVDRVEDKTTGRSFQTDYDIFIERLRTKLFELGKGRVTLIENKARFHGLQSKELEGGGERDDFGQGGPDKAGPPAGVQPDFVLYGKAMDMPNRATNYYLLQFDLTNLKSRVQVWSGSYEVRAKR